jgi:hypothetical protein
VAHRLCSRPSNREVPTAVPWGVPARVEQRYRDFGLAQAAEKLAEERLALSHESLPHSLFYRIGPVPD